MKKLKLILGLLWFTLISFFPYCIGLIYMNITGNGKGYAYDMGSEAYIAVASGILLLLLWLIVLFPTFIWLCKRFFEYRKAFVLIPIIGFTALFSISILKMGWGEFIKLFGFGYI